MITVSRPYLGISLNGDEFLLDDSGNVMKFQNKEQAREFLIDSGMEEYELDALNFHEEEE
jgi:hypothetical protein